jgi:hypothetical protein
MDLRKNLSVSTEDLAAGQVVIVAARWVLIGAGLVFSIWHPSGLNELRVQLLVLFLLGMVNFYLQAQAMTKRATLAEIIYATSVADLAVISLLIYAGNGLSSQLFIFYFPALLALSVAFTTELTVVYTAAAAGLYAVTCLAFLGDEAALGDDLQVLFIRLLMFAAVAACGNIYWRIESQRRHTVETELPEAHERFPPEVNGAAPARAPLQSKPV